MRDRARADLEAAEAEAERLRGAEVPPALPPLEAVLREAGEWAAALRDGDVAAQREVLAALLDRAVAERVGRGCYRVEVGWTPLGEALCAACSISAVADASPVAAWGRPSSSRSTYALPTGSAWGNISGRVGRFQFRSARTPRRRS